MTQRIENLKTYLITGQHHRLRREVDFDPSVYRSGPLHRRTALRLRAMLTQQDVVFLADERFAFTRTTKDFPDILTDDESRETKSAHFIHELGYVCNICPDYAGLIERGINAELKRISQAKGACAKSADYFDSLTLSLQAMAEFSERYRIKAAENGLDELAETLSRIPRRGASTFFEALQFFRLIHFCLWCEGNYHVTIGRFDQYMYPWLQADLSDGRLTEESALELLEEFFLTFNKDTDLYRGMQQGDNGQSMMLGGTDTQGNDAYNLLSELCLKAQLELCVIDPKLNLRVSKKTPPQRYAFASQLTAKGLGFPQYSNDDVVIPGLINKGYTREDATNYTVAACWEFIIPKKGMDIPNIDAISFLQCVDTVMRTQRCGDFPAFMLALTHEITSQTLALAHKHENIFMRPSPLMSVLMQDCVETGRDISQGGIYNNYGIHGTGIAAAADAVIAVKKLVYEDRLTMEELIVSLDHNFEGSEALYNRIKLALPKMGNNDDEVDDIACTLLDAFADACDSMHNERGGCYRAGTGSAMYYVSHAQQLGATADGRRKGDFLPANYSPSLGTRLHGPFSAIQSFTKPNLVRVINGGPLTLEIAASAIHHQAEKLGLLVKSFIDLGGHQLQLNVISRDALRKALDNPEQYRNLVVRVWGWSGYFTELDKVYQEHILKRSDFDL